MRSAGACIHTHSQHAVMLTLLLPRRAESFRISHQEMIKGVRLGGTGKTLRFFDTLEVPIIENTADEEDLTSGMAEVGPTVYWEDGSLTRIGDGEVPRRAGYSRPAARRLRMG